MSSSRGASLTPIFPPASSTVNQEHDAIVVVVPEIGARAASTWSSGSGCWLESLLPYMVNKPYVLEFHHDLPNHRFNWQYFLHQSDLLVEELRKLIQAHPDRLTPLIFICHGLGGFIVKKVVRIIHDQFHKPDFDRLFKMLAGVVLLGCPHPTFDKPADWPKVSAMLKEATGLSKGAVNDASNSMPTMANISKNFEESDTDIEILSIYDGRPTKLKGAFFRRQILVDESLATTRSKRERIVKVDATHARLCHVLSGSPLHTELAQFLATIQSQVFLPPIQITEPGGKSVAGWSVTSPVEEKNYLTPSGDTSNVNVQASSSDRSGYEMIPTKSMDGVAACVNLPCYMMGPHSPLPEFCGRSEALKQLHSALTPPKELANPRKMPQLRTFAICGAGGLGKTQVAVTFAYECKDCKEFDAIFWVQADDRGKLAQSYADIALKLGLEDSSVDQVVSRDLVVEWLSEPIHQVHEGRKLPPSGSEIPRWLLIFDNADDLSVLQDYWPVTGKGSILITSRDPLARTQTYFQCDGGINLEPFTREEAVTLMKSMTGFSSAEDLALSATIAEKLSYFPMAVNQMAKTINRRSLSLPEFLKYYEEEELREEFNQMHVGISTPRGTTPKSIATVWSLQDLSASAARLFDIISFMDPDLIQEHVLPWGSGSSPNDNHIVYPVLLQDYPASKREFLNARAVLISSSLLSRNVRTGELTTHRIIQDTNRLRMSPSHYKTVFSTVCDILCHAWPFSEFDWDPARWRLCEPIISHVTHLRDMYTSKKAVVEADTMTAANLSRLLMDAGWYYVERGSYGQTPVFLDLAEELCGLAPTKTMITQADICYCRAELANMKNDPHAAVPFADRYLSLVAQHDPQGWRMAQAHNIVGAISLGTGDFAKAAYHADKAITLYAALPVPEYVAFAYINKAHGLRLTGHPTEAAAVLELYLQETPERGDPSVTEPFKAAQAKALLGQVYRDLGQFAKSVTMHQQALTMFTGVTGEDIRTAAIYAGLGDAHRSMREFKEAKEAYSRALDLWSKSSEPLPEASRAYFELSRMCDKLGEFDEAADARYKAEQSLRKLGPNLTEGDINDLLPAWART